jgi:short-subunit dehydrogenase
MRRNSNFLAGQSVVITGASSGIGLATALAFARAGCNLTLTARREEPLNDAAAACEALGARAIAVPTDVTDLSAMERLAAAASVAFGKIDAWINNAGVGLFGPFAAADLPSHRRVVEINLFGTMHGAAAVLPHFLKRGQGILMTNISVGGFVPVPFAAAYTASKFGMRGFMASLRQELAHAPAIRLCSVFPTTVDTPGFEHGANVSGRRLEAPRLALEPERVAALFVHLAQYPRPETAIGIGSSSARLSYGVAPTLTERLIGWAARRFIRHGPRAPLFAGNLFSPVERGVGARGSDRQQTHGRRYATPALAVAGAAAVGAFAAWRHVQR